MKSRAINTTKAQDDYRASIIGKKKIIKKQYPRVWKHKNQHRCPMDKTENMTPQEKSIYYLNNCVFWLNEYLAGNIDSSKIKSVANSLILLLPDLPYSLPHPPKDKTHQGEQG